MEFICYFQSKIKTKLRYKGKHAKVIPMPSSFILNLSSNMIKTAFGLSNKSQCNDKRFSCSNHRQLDMHEQLMIIYTTEKPTNKKCFPSFTKAPVISKHSFK